MSTTQTPDVSSTFMDQFADAKRVIGSIEAAMKALPLEWTLIAPDGRLWQGSQQQVARVLLQNIDVASLFKGDHQQRQDGGA